jgi:peptidoglycan/xylan/chitin deacetylase (PgdA/CDA1 family)
MRGKRELSSRPRAAALILTLVFVPVVAATRLDATPASLEPQLAGTMPEVEQAILGAVRAVKGVVWIAADTNGHLTVASLGFTPGTPALAAPAPPDALAWRLAQLAFAALPTLDEVHLSAVQPSELTLDLGHLPVTFSCAISRREFMTVPETIGGSQALARLQRVWYAFGSIRGTPGTPESRRAASLPEVAPPKTQTTASPAPDGIHPTPSLHDPNRLPGASRVYVVFRGDPTRREVAITFDDGPFPIYTTLLLDTLARLGIKATFFLVGEQVQRYPYFAQATVRAGHEVGNHTFHHARLSQLSEKQIEDEITRAQEVIAEVTGVRPRYFRPPGGKFAFPVIHTASALGLTTVFWTANSGDYARPGVAVLESKILGRLNSGGILLLHEGVGETIRILPHATEVLRQRRLILTSVSGLLTPQGIGTLR